MITYTFVCIGQEYEEILLTIGKDEDEEKKRKKAYNRLNKENVTYNRVYDVYKNVIVNIDFQNIHTYIYISYNYLFFLTIKRFLYSRVELYF